MVGVLGAVDGGVDVVTLAAVVLAANDELEITVVLCFVNDTGELLERCLVDDRADEV